MSVSGTLIARWSPDHGGQGSTVHAIITSNAVVEVFWGNLSIKTKSAASHILSLLSIRGDLQVIYGQI